MLQAAVHSMYSRPGRRPASLGRTTGACSFFIGSLSAQSPQNFEPPRFSSSRSWAIVWPVQTSLREEVRVSPRTRRPYGSAHPHTTRPSQRSTRVSQGQEQVKRVARKFRDIQSDNTLPEIGCRAGVIRREVAMKRTYVTLLGAGLMAAAAASVFAQGGAPAAPQVIANP